MAKKEYLVKMTKDEMLRFYANKIVEEGIKECTEFNTLVQLTDFNTEDIKLEKYKNEILQLLYRDERLADVVIDDELNIDMVFYTDYCPFYYDEEESNMYNQIEDNPKYQSKILEEFVDYIHKRVMEDSYISTKTLINHFVDIKTNDKEYSYLLSNFLKKNIIQTGFVEKNISGVTVCVTPSNYKELEDELL
jgi:hypothetical protein